MSPFVRPSAVRHADRMLARSVVLILLAVFTATQTTQPDVMDGEVEFQTTSSLVRRSSLALGGTPEAEAIVNAEVPGPAGTTRRGFNGSWGGPGREGEFFSWFGVGQAFVGVPFYLLGSLVTEWAPQYDERHALQPHLGVARSEYFEHLFVGWRNPLLAALTAGLVVYASRRLGIGRPAALVAGLSYGLCTFAWPQARSTLNSVQAAFWTFYAFHQVLAIEESLARHQRPSKLTLLLCGLALGAMFLTRSLLAPVIVVLGLAAVFVLWRGYRRLGQHLAALDALWIALPAVACFGVFLVTNEARFGDPLESGYGDVVTWDSYFVYPLHHGLISLLASPGQGLLWMAPGVVLAVPWLVGLVRRGNVRLTIVVLGVAAAVLVPVCMTVGWHGAWGYGPRYALPLLPFLWLGVGALLDAHLDRPLRRLGIAALLFLGVVVALAGTLVDTTTHTDLALQSAQMEWPVIEGADGLDADEERFQRIHWTPRYAAPAAHWRIFRHRVAGLGESFDPGEIFFVDAQRVTGPIAPQHARERGFSHLAWYDFAHRLGGPLWPVGLLCALLLLAGTVYAIRGLDPSRR